MGCFFEVLWWVWWGGGGAWPVEKGEDRIE